MTLVIPGPPVAKPRLTQRDKWKKRPCALKFFEYRDRVRAKMGAYNIADMQTLDCIFYVPFPRSYSQKKRELLQDMPHRERPDLDNFVKALSDSLFVEDCHISTIVASKVWDDGQGGRTVIHL